MSYINNNIKGRGIPKINTASDENKSNRSQTSFAQVAGVTDVTLRHTIKDLKNQLLLLN